MRRGKSLGFGFAATLALICPLVVLGALEYKGRAFARIVDIPNSGGPPAATVTRYLGNAECQLDGAQLTVNLDDIDPRFGDGGITITPAGPLQRLPNRPRTYVGEGAATAIRDSGATQQFPIRIVAQRVGNGNRSRIQGRFWTVRQGPVDPPTSLLNGSFRAVIEPNED